MDNDIRHFIKELTNAWLEERYDDLNDFFHQDVVLLPPGSVTPIIGKELVIDSYRQFAKVGTVHTFDILDITLHEYEHTTVCDMLFEVDYELDSGRYHERGLEVYVIDTSGSKFNVLWRTQFQLPEH